MAQRFSRSWLSRRWWLVVLVGILALRLVFDQSSNPLEQLPAGEYTVRRVVDGDTLLLANGVRVRLQGIDTPETVRPDHPVQPWGPEAKEFTEKFVSSAGGVAELTFGAERLDRYGRHLAFVWHGDQLLNEQLVEQGLARARLGYRYSGTMKRRLADAEEHARSTGCGIWSDEAPFHMNTP